MRRPAAVTTAFWLTVLEAAINVVIGAFTLVVGYAMIGNALLLEPSAAVQAAVAGVALAVGIVLVLVAVAMFRGRNWARVTLIVVQVLAALFALVGLFGDQDPVSRVSGILTVVIGVVVVVLLSMPKAKEFFVARSRSTGVAG